MLLAAILAIAAATAPVQSSAQPGSAVDICMRAAAAVGHTTVKDADRDECACADQQLHKLLHGGDYALHEEMQTIIAGGANEASFNKQLSGIMLKRGMNQSDADQFFARLKTAEGKAQAACNTEPLMGPELAPQPRP
jgi:hypothetical protein